MIGHHVHLDSLVRKTYNTASGCDPPLIVRIHLTVHLKFGVSITFCSGVIVCHK